MASTERVRLPAGVPAATHGTGRRIVLTTFGSFGDVHPYMAIALELKARGHEPVLATSEVYRDKIEGEGIAFAPVRPDAPDPAEPEAMAEIIARVMDAKTGSEYLFTDLVMPPLRESYQDLRRAITGADLLVTHMITFAGPILAEQTGIKWVSTVLAPLSLWSVYDPPVLPGVPAGNLMTKLRPAAVRAMIRIARWKSQQWIEPVYRLRAELGMPPGAHPLFEGQHSPALILALFSGVLGAPQADWPPQTRITGFCFYDKRDGTKMSSEIKQFLDSGPAPIVFTLGSSAVFDPRNFYRDSIAAARQLGRRAVLLIGDQRNLPAEPLPDGIVAYEYAPYSELLPHAAAIVHQGGVGTTGQALRAGRPMLVMPYSHDQPDNAARITRLGAGRTLPRHRYNARTAAAELSALLGDPSYAGRAAEVGREVQSEHGPASACDAIEELISHRNPRKPTEFSRKSGN